MTAPLPKGYKRTEVGVIPEEWDVKRIGDFTDCTAGGTPSTDIPRYWGGDIRWMSSGELHQKLVYEVEGRITEEGLRNSSAKIVPANCVLVGLAGQGKTRGTVAINKVPLCTNQSIAAIFPNENFVSEYLFYNLENRYLELRSLSTGDGGRGGLNLTIIRNILVPFPPLPEQRAIAAALSDVDSLLAALDRLIAKKRAVKAAAMRDLLTGRVRLPGFEGSGRFKQTEAGLVPEEWEGVTIEDIAYIVSGGTPNTQNPRYWDGGIMWCTPSDITANHGKYLFKTERTISAEGLRNSSATLLPASTLLLCSRATIGDVKIAKNEVATNQGFKSLIVDTKKADAEFVYYQVLTLKDKLVQRGVGSTFLEVSKKDVATLSIRLPPIYEQTAIAAVLSDLDAELEALERERAKWQSIKQGMMDDLLTGRVRLG